MLLEYFEKHSLIIQDTYNSLKSSYNAEAVHNFRISLKRVKVVLQFLEFLTDSELIASDQIKKYRPIYKKTGRVRDLHVQIELYKTISEELKISDNSYPDYLSIRESKADKKLKLSLKEDDLLFLSEIRELIFSNTKDSSEDLLLEKGNAFASIKFAGIKELYTSENSQYLFHAIRTLLKDIYYLNNIFRHQLQLNDILNIDQERLNELGSMFGAWHDKGNAVSFLKRFLKKNPEEKEAYDNLLSILNQRKKEEFLLLDRVLREELKMHN